MADNLALVSALQPFSTPSALGSGTVARGQAKADAPEQFEAFVLQSFIQEMLPKDAENVFGKGLAGDIWRSMLSEQFAAQLAERGALGIAEQVRAGERMDASQASRAPSLTREMPLNTSGTVEGS